jgi:hypothetical protein
MFNPALSLLSTFFIYAALVVVHKNLVISRVAVIHCPIKFLLDDLP